MFVRLFFLKGRLKDPSISMCNSKDVDLKSRQPMVQQLVLVNWLLKLDFCSGTKRNANCTTYCSLLALLPYTQCSGSLPLLKQCVTRRKG